MHMQLAHVEIRPYVHMMSCRFVHLTHAFLVCANAISECAGRVRVCEGAYQCRLPPIVDKNRLRSSVDDLHEVEIR